MKTKVHQGLRADGTTVIVCSSEPIRTLKNGVEFEALLLRHERVATHNARIKARQERKP